LLESCGWLLYFLLAQVAAGAGLIVILLLAAYGGWPSDTSAALQLLLDLNLDSDFILIGVTQLGALALIVPAVRLRTGPAFRERLQLKRPDTRNLLLAIGAVAPLAVLSKGLLGWAMEQWSLVASQFPALQPLSDANSLETIAGLSANEPFLILVVALAVGPALGEELIFRGLIGNGLLQRWGTVLGVVITSVLFAGAHAFPPHAIALLPLSFFLHYALLRTGSLWTSIILHGLNNALAVAMMKYPLLGRLPDSPVVLVAAALYVGVVVLFLGGGWERRSRLRALLTGSGPRIGWLDAVAGSCIVGFTTAFVWSVVTAR
jgi:membrane protease YdiL (CAAX protease family)